MDVGLKNAERYNTMARYTGAVTKYLRRFGMTDDEKQRPRSPRGPSQYAIRLEEKQKLRVIYGVLERQFRKYYQQALRQKGNTEENFLRQLETRLDNVVFRLGYARTRQQARQLVSHGHVLVNDKKINIPSYQVVSGDMITLRSKALNLGFVQQNLEEAPSIDTLEWLERKGPVGRIKTLPLLKDMNVEVDVSLIIEYYSR